jgi:hypothetical protein
MEQHSTSKLSADAVIIDNVRSSTRGAIWSASSNSLVLTRCADERIEGHNRRIPIDGDTRLPTRLPKARLRCRCVPLARPTRSCPWPSCLGTPASRWPELALTPRSEQLPARPQPMALFALAPAVLVTLRAGSPWTRRAPSALRSWRGACAGSSGCFPAPVSRGSCAAVRAPHRHSR